MGRKLEKDYRSACYYMLPKSAVESESCDVRTRGSRSILYNSGIYENE